MPPPRLPFLYPPLLRSFISTRPRPRPPCRVPQRCRHGTAVEPIPPPPPPPPPVHLPKDTTAIPDAPASKQSSDSSAPSSSTAPPSPSPSSSSPAAASKPDASPNTSPSPSTSTSKDAVPVASTAVSKDGALPATAAVNGGDSALSSSGGYVHHFDTYTLVQRLSAGSHFTPAQSVAVMKGIRDLLSAHLSAANTALVSKSALENDSYVFSAASSELRNEIQNARRLQVEALRFERTRIQQEFDACSQTFLGEMMQLKDELNGMFNDRKMVTRAEQRAMENKIQELNYKITVMMNSDIKSEVEKLRWITTRRGLIAIACLAIFTITILRFNSSEAEHQRKEKKSKQEAEEQHSSHLAVSDASSASTFESLG